jgi:nucleotide-binding universal stress UspA family protein
VHPAKDERLLEEKKMKDALVLVTGHAEDDVRLGFTDKLAATFDADVDIVLANELPPPSVTSAMPLAVATQPAGLADAAAHDAAIKTGAKYEAHLRERVSKRKGRVRLTRLDETAGGLATHVSRLASTRDVFVCSLPGREHEHELAGTIMDRVLTDSGRSVIGLPRGWKDSQPVHHVTVAWNGSRESVRAITEAMPLLQRAMSVAVLLVDQLRRAGDETRPGADILLHLQRHGVEAKVVHISKEEMKTADAILTECKRLGADMLVMGAQAEGGVLQWFKGSVSRDVVARTEIPVLLAH